jgi:hypothetical protein
MRTLMMLVNTKHKWADVIVSVALIMAIYFFFVRG